MKILCATDLEPGSEAAMDRAGLLAAQLDAELILLHVVPHSSSASALERSLQACSERMRVRTRAPLWRNGPAPHTMIRIGSTAKLVARTAEEIGADLVVMGPHASPARTSLAGTIAARLLSERRWPVLISRQPVERTYHDVLLALDFDPGSAAIIRAAESLVLHDVVNASVVHSCHVPYNAMLDSAGVPQPTVAEFAGLVITQARDNIRELLAREGNGMIQYSVIVRRDAAAVAIERVASRTLPDLIVLGTRGHGPVRRALLGSVANRVLESAQADVLVVPEDSVAGVVSSAPLARGVASNTATQRSR